MSLESMQANLNIWNLIYWIMSEGDMADTRRAELAFDDMVRRIDGEPPTELPEDYKCFGTACNGCVWYENCPLIKGKK